jgi:hypothetical protein
LAMTLQRLSIKRYSNRDEEGAPAPFAPPPAAAVIAGTAGRARR